MSRLFRYIQNDDVVKSFSELKKNILRERPVVIARHGDYSLFLKLISDNELGLTIENTLRHRIIQDRSYDITSTPNEIVSRGVRHACQKMAELSDADVNRMRLQIWKWYLSEWQIKEGSTKEIAEKVLSWNDDSEEKEAEMLDLESFLHGEYLNLGNTLSLIEKYLADDEKHKEQFKKFAVEDIMDMTSEDTKDRSLKEAEEKREKEGMKKHTYRFTVSVEATDKEHARQALLSYLAGDERIRVQK
jgi:ribosomal protein L20A (L18A)